MKSIKDIFNYNTRSHLKSAAFGVGLGVASMGAGIVGGMVAGSTGAQVGQIASFLGGMYLLNADTRLRPSKPWTAVITAMASSFVLPRILMGVFMAVSGPAAAAAPVQHDAIVMTPEKPAAAAAPRPA